MNPPNHPSAYLFGPFNPITFCWGRLRARPPTETLRPTKRLAMSQRVPARVSTDPKIYHTNQHTRQPPQEKETLPTAARASTDRGLPHRRTYRKVLPKAARVSADPHKPTCRKVPPKKAALPNTAPASADPRIYLTNQHGGKPPKKENKSANPEVYLRDQYTGKSPNKIKHTGKSKKGKGTLPQKETRAYQSRPKNSQISGSTSRPTHRTVTLRGGGTGRQPVNPATPPRVACRR